MIDAAVEETHTPYAGGYLASGSDLLGQVLPTSDSKPPGRAYYGFYRRYLAEGVEGLRTRSKKPHTSPNATHADVVGKIIYLRRHR